MFSHTQLGAMPSRPCSPTINISTTNHKYYSTKEIIYGWQETETRCNQINNQNYGTTSKTLKQLTKHMKGGWEGQARKWLMTKTTELWNSDQSLPHTWSQTPSSMWERLLSASFVPQREENHTFFLIPVWENEFGQMKCLDHLGCVTLLLIRKVART